MWSNLVLLLFALTFLATKSMAWIEAGHIGYRVVNGEPVGPALYPGLKWIGFFIQAYQVREDAELKRVEQEVRLPDGSEFKITVSYTVEPDPQGVWKLHKYGNRIDSIMEDKITSCLSRYSSISTGGPQTGNEMIEAYDDIRHEVRRVLNVELYGLRLAELEVKSIKSDSPGKLRPRTDNQIEKAKRRAGKLKELEPLAEQLRKVGTPEPEIKRIIEKARMDILDDE